MILCVQSEISMESLKDKLKTGLKSSKVILTILIGSVYSEEYILIAS